MVGAIFYPQDLARTVPAWRDYMASAPEELGSLAFFWNVPEHEPFPPEPHGQAVLVLAAVYSGSVEDGEPVVQPLRELAQPLVDLSGPWPWLGLQSGFDALFPPGQLRYWKSRAFAELTEEAIDEIADWAARRPTPLTDITIWHHGGAMSRVGESETAYAGRDAPSSSPGKRAGLTRRRPTRPSLGAGRSGMRWAGTPPAASTSTSRAGRGERGARQGGLRSQLRPARRAEGQI